ncbi:hypothetical protein HK097_008894 [Rhizophlyctis rosea]|uniref:Calcineurin-like phosphoesterase domain-containing protein n=1 Tax=Rhizophlyctis rosea TaxID=64517 RepID=A0AAD5SBA4_9FUNG|nr:hypothetical protein HK097_008894 [Rhizophlyctis rosea]
MEGARIYAANAIRKKNEALELLRLSFRIDTVGCRVQTAVTMRKVTTGMAGFVKGMDKAMVPMNLEQLSMVVDQFEQQIEDLDAQTQYMEISMGQSTAQFTLQNQVEDLMQRLADENGLELQTEMYVVLIPTLALTDVEITTYMPCSINRCSVGPFMEEMNVDSEILMNSHSILQDGSPCHKYDQKCSIEIGDKTVVFIGLQLDDDETAGADLGGGGLLMLGSPAAHGIGPGQGSHEEEDDGISQDQDARLTLGSSRTEIGQEEKRRVLFAVSDLHGDTEGFKRLLRLAGLYNNKGWMQGVRADLIIVGDAVDKGPHVQSMLRMIRKLSLQALMHEGYVAFLNGNHEVINLGGNYRYAHEIDNRTFGTIEQRRSAFSRSGDIGKYLRGLDFIHQAEGHVFLHGGVSPMYLDDILSHNRRCQEKLERKEGRQIYQDGLLNGRQSPVWYRGHIQNDEVTECPHIDRVLDKFKAERLIVGHTVSQNGKVIVRCGGKVLGIDTGNSAWHYTGYVPPGFLPRRRAPYYTTRSIIRIDNEGVWAIYEEIATAEEAVETETAVQVVESLEEVDVLMGRTPGGVVVADVL